MTKKHAFLIMVLGSLLLGTGIANAAEEVLACVGRHVQDTTSASFLLSNFNGSEIITIDRIRVFNAAGILQARTLGRMGLD